MRHRPAPSKPLPTTGKLRVLVAVAILVTAFTGMSDSDASIQQDDRDSQQTPRNDREWLTRNSDGTVTFHFQGQVLDEAGNPVEIGETSVQLNLLNHKESAPAAHDGSRFNFAVPGKRTLHSFTITATSADGDKQTSRLVQSIEFRQLARDGLALRMRPRRRAIHVRPQFEGQSIANTDVYLSFGFSYVAKGKTDENGVASIKCPDDLDLREITVLKENEFVGGISFSRLPGSDPTSNEQTVEMVRTRRQVLTLVDEAGEPLVDTEFTLEVSPGAPDYNYLGTGDLFKLATDSNGESIVPWFPDFEEPHFYIRLNDPDADPQRPHRVLEDGSFEVTVNQILRQERQRISGSVTSRVVKDLSGFKVMLKSFEGETENRMDFVCAYTDSQGMFVADVLPGATYCIYLDDDEFVSRPQDHLLFDIENGQTVKPQVYIEEGELVRLFATHGPHRAPYRDLSITLNSDHPFTWRDEDGTQRGSVGKTTYAKTDSQGVAEVRVSAGVLETSIRTNNWQYEDEFEVTEGEANTIRIHRPNLLPLKLRGRIEAAVDNTDLSETLMYVASYDGYTSGQQQVKVDEEGAFEFETTSATIAVFAYNADGAGSFFEIVDTSSRDFEFQLRPTAEYRGRLLDDKGEPLSDFTVTAKVSHNAGWNSDYPIYRELKGNTIQCQSDADGFFTFANMPTGVRVSLGATSPDDQRTRRGIGERFVVSGEERPLDVVRFGTAKTPAAKDLRATLDSTSKTCELYGLRVLVVLLSDDDSSKLAQRVIDYDDNRAVLGYLPALVHTKDIATQPDRQALLKEKGWSVPEAGEVFIAIMEPDGATIGSLTLRGSDRIEIERAHEFITTFEPPANDAQEVFEQALAEAKQTGRVVWAQHSQTRCGPCFRLSRWIDEHREILEKDFVFIKIDNVRDQKGSEISKVITGDGRFGIPFVAIFDGEGNRLIDGESPLGNIGFPSNFEGALHLRRMIKKTATRISEKELEQLVNSLIE